jgi:glutaredoxin-related protein
MNTQERIKEIVTSHPVVLFMKGTPQFPQCGFSGRAIQILNAYNPPVVCQWRIYWWLRYHD